MHLRIFNHILIMLSSIYNTKSKPTCIFTCSNRTGITSSKTFSAFVWSLITIVWPLPLVLPWSLSCSASFSLASSSCASFDWLVLQSLNGFGNGTSRFSFNFRASFSVRRECCRYPYNCKVETCFRRRDFMQNFSMHCHSFPMMTWTLA